ALYSGLSHYTGDDNMAACWMLSKQGEKQQLKRLSGAAVERWAEVPAFDFFFICDVTPAMVPAAAMVCQGGLEAGARGPDSHRGVSIL
ncbi:unnamed protein product, partial [Gadus morhua 'NCC']